MTEPNHPHNIDVSIRTVVMTAARSRVRQMRAQERRQDGVPKTTMASVGREILVSWEPESTKAVGEVDGVPLDAAGNRLTLRGHRKYARSVLDAAPPRGDGMPDNVRASQLLAHLKRVADPVRGTTLGPIAAVKKAAKNEGLLNLSIEGKTLRAHIGVAERAVLKPLRFTLPEDVYQQIYRQLQEHGCTITRALEVGLERFARTGETTTPKG